MHKITQTWSSVGSIDSPAFVQLANCAKNHSLIARHLIEHQINVHASLFLIEARCTRTTLVIAETLPLT